MPEGPKKECRGTLDERVMMLLATCGCRLVEREDILQSIRAAGRGKRWTWVEKWVDEEGPRWVNDMDTVVFEFPSEGLTGERSLAFTQMVWRCQPRDFWYQVWGGRCFVRMWWDRNRP
ncbi:hypothetical protein OJF2_77000 [Aquisphaera giovannonii]|uniref:Uncharacterized protein n=1 Tax=Aquisphaera giovannonii TaxID=406548 RepID=A0A5B9WEK6_9BACT|nr:hypothetical protein OJF2_77000 [Aquisphaera giovannonii]